MKRLGPGDVDCRNCVHFRRVPPDAKIVILDRRGEVIAEGNEDVGTRRRLRYCEVYQLLDGDLIRFAGSLAEMAKNCKEFKFAPGKGPEAEEDKNEQN